MKYRLFSGTDISVSEIGFGTWTLSTGWWGEKTDDEAVAMLRRAHDDFGITFFDAADSYGNGRAEHFGDRRLQGRHVITLDPELVDVVRNAEGEGIVRELDELNSGKPTLKSVCADVWF